MPAVDANGVRLHYEREGRAGGEPLVLIHGVGAQLVRWPQPFVDALGGAGFDIVRFDNRDIGLSTRFDEAGIPDLAAIVEAQRRGEAPPLPYTLADMAADTAGLMDALGIGRAHVLGVSLGGMIAQVLAIGRPERVASLAVVMSQSGNPELPRSDPAAVAALSAAAPDPAVDEEGFVRHSIALNRTLGSPRYPVAEDELRAFAMTSARRAHNPAGAARQMAAARGAPDRRSALRGVRAPTLVIHGRDDPLIPVAGGIDVARHVPGSWLLDIDGMGHDLPAELFDLIVSTVAANARRARA